MQVVELHLRNFRNYREQGMRFAPGCNILYGANGAGKTNVLEALFFLATLRSHRTSRDQELLRWGGDSLSVHAQVRRSASRQTLDVQLTEERRKRVRINGQAQTKLSDFIGQLNAVLFAPEDLQLLKGPPAGRRRLLDVSLAQSSRAYLHHLQEYHRALAQRNALLRTGMTLATADALLDVWDEPLVLHGAQIIRHRVLAVERWHAFAAEYHRFLSDGREELTIRYGCSLGTDADETSAESFRSRLAASRREELLRGTTLVGPHRDDLEVAISGRDARHYASQGQQRSAILAIKFAELRRMAEETGETPVLLLDDVTSELDANRRSFLLQAVAGHLQVFITTTGLADLDHRWLEGAALFQVEEGSLTGTPALPG